MRANLSVRQAYVAVLIGASLLLPRATPAQAPPPASQNPSPMSESTRAHERLAPRELAGVTRSFTGPLDKPVELFIPNRLQSRRTFDLLIHFHGAAFVAHTAAAELNGQTVAAVLNLGAGSGVYHRAFANPVTFDSLLDRIREEVASATGVSRPIGRVILSGFSAGHGAVRAILLDRAHFDRIAAILLLDGMHTSYVPEGTVLASGGTLDTTNLTALAEFARAASRGEKRFLVTHSEIFPGTFASTTETSDWILNSLGLRPTPVLRWGSHGMQQLSEVRAGHFELLGFAGNTAPDHIDHLHAMPVLLRRLLKP